MERGAKTKQSIEKIIIICLMLKFFFCSSMEKFKARSRYFLYESSSVRESFFVENAPHSASTNSPASSEHELNHYGISTYTMCRSITLLTGKSSRVIRLDDGNVDDDKGERKFESKALKPHARKCDFSRRLI